MSDPSPRRRRSSSDPPPPAGGNPLPTIALGIGVIVAGLGIGALISAYQNRAVEPAPAVAVSAAPIYPPIAQVTQSPIAVATAIARPSPSATSTPLPSPSARPSPSPSPTPTPTPAPSASPSPRATPSGAPSPTATPSPPATHAPSASPTRLPPSPPPTSRPVAVATIRATTAPTVRPSAAAPVAAATAAPTAGDAAQGAVRRYLGALIGGNESGAYAALGGSPGDRALALKEEAFIDKDTHITSIRTSASDAAGATVEVELTSNRGTYFATYHVTNGSGGPVIDQHDYIKV